MENLYLVGGGGHCRACIDVIESTGIYRIAGIFDRPEMLEKDIQGYPLIGSDSDIPRYIRSDNMFLVTVGQIKSPDVRIKIFDLLVRGGASLATVVSPRAYVSPSAKLAPGTVVMHDALVNANAVIGKNCILNTKSLIEHDAIVEDHCHISTGAIVNGAALVQEGSFLGSNAVVRENGLLPPRSIISAGRFVKERRS